MLQAYLPDALGALQGLHRVGRSAAVPTGGAPIKVRVVKGANLAMEHVDAADARLAARDLRHQAGDRHQLQARARLGAHPRAHRRRAHRRRRPQPLRRRLRLAAREAARRRATAVEFEMLLGMATGQAEAVAQRRRQPAALHARREPGRVRRGDHLPRPSPRGEREHRELHVGGVRARHEPDALLDARDATASSRRSPPSTTRPGPNRTQDRSRRRAGRCPSPRRRRRRADRPDPHRRAPRHHAGSRATPALRTHPAASPTSPTPTRRSPANRAWGRAHPRRASAASTLGVRHHRRCAGDGRRRRSTPSSPQSSAAGRALGQRAGAERAADPAPRGRLALAANRGRLIEVMAHRDRQDHRRGRPRGQRGDRLRALLRRARPRARHGRTARTFVPVAAHRRHAAVELPGRDPGRRRARRARRGLRRHHQARPAGPAHAAPSWSRRCGRPASRATCSRSSTSPSSDLGTPPRRAPGGRPRDPHRRVRDGASCSARCAPTCRCSPRRAARTRSSSRRRPTSTSRRPTSSRAPSATPARSARPHRS